MAESEVKPDAERPNQSALGKALGLAGKAMDGLTDGAVSIISHGSAEAAAALFTGAGFVQYGQGMTPSDGLESLQGTDNGNLGSLEPPAVPAHDRDNELER